MSMQDQLVVFEKTFRLPAAPSRVFEALTDPAQVQAWFAEHSRVEPRVGGAYRFWGRFTPWAAAQDAADQRITAFEAPTRLAYTWTWRGAATVVEIRLATDGDATKLTVRHEAPASLWPRAEEVEPLLGDFWWVAASNLRAYLRTGRAALREDYTRRARDVSLSIEIDAPPQRVFAALTDPAQMNRWIATAAQCEPRAGGAYSYGWKFAGEKICGPTRMLSINPGREISHDWVHGDEKPSQVTWRLEPLPDGRTRVVLTHVFAEAWDDARDGYVQGWSRYLFGLADHASGGAQSV